GGHLGDLPLLARGDRLQGMPADAAAARLHLDERNDPAAASDEVDLLPPHPEVPLDDGPPDALEEVGGACLSDLPQPGHGRVTPTARRPPPAAPPAPAPGRSPGRWWRSAPSARRTAPDRATGPRPTARAPDPGGPRPSGRPLPPPPPRAPSGSPSNGFPCRGWDRR